MARPFSPQDDARHARADLDPHAAREQRTQHLLREAAAARSASRRDHLRQEAAALNVDMALGVARPYHGRGIDDDDIDQVAYLGLWKAVLGFTGDPTAALEDARTTDPEEDGSTPASGPGAGVRPSARDGLGVEARPRRFAAYAIPTITGEVKRHFRDHGWMVRPPRQVQEHTLAVNHAVTTLRQTLLREPTDTEVAVHLGITRRELDQARQAREGYHAQSIDTPVHGDGRTTLTDTLPATVPGETDDYTLLDTSLTLRWAIGRLTDADRRLLALRYTQGLTQTDIGAVLGVSQMQVSRLLNRVHRRLHDHLTLEAS